MEFLKNTRASCNQQGRGGWSQHLMPVSGLVVRGPVYRLPFCAPVTPSLLSLSQQSRRTRRNSWDSLLLQRCPPASSTWSDARVKLQHVRMLRQQSSGSLASASTAPSPLPSPALSRTSSTASNYSSCPSTSLPSFITSPFRQLWSAQPLLTKSPPSTPAPAPTPTPATPRGCPAVSALLAYHAAQVQDAFGEGGAVAARLAAAGPSLSAGWETTVTYDACGSYGSRGGGGGAYSPTSSSASGCTQYSVASYGVVGKRSYTEDFAVHLDLGCLPVFASRCRRAGLSLLLDGHGGRAAVHQAALRLPALLLADGGEGLLAAPEEALRRAVAAAEGELLAVGCEAGCTLVAAVLLDGEVTVCWVGDSRAVLYGTVGRRVLAATCDHSMAEEGERQRVAAAGGQASSCGKCVLVGPAAEPLGVTRALGHAGAKDWQRRQGQGQGHGCEVLVAEPEVCRWDVPDDGCVLVLGCDGVLDVMRNGEVGSTALRAMVGACAGAAEGQGQGQGSVLAGACSAAARELVSRALKLGSDDNVTALVLRPGGRPVEAPRSHSMLGRGRRAAEEGPAAGPVEGPVATA